MYTTIEHDVRELAKLASEQVRYVYSPAAGQVERLDGQSQGDEVLELVTAQEMFNYYTSQRDGLPELNEVTEFSQLVRCEVHFTGNEVTKKVMTISLQKDRIDMGEFADWFKRKKEARGFTAWGDVTNFSKFLGINDGVVSRLLSGERLPTSPQLETIFTKLDVPADERAEVLMMHHRDDVKKQAQKRGQK